MKRLMIAVLMLVFVGVGLAQNTSQLNSAGNPTAERARLFKTHTNYGIGTGDTTGFVTVNLPGWASDPLLCSEVYIIGVATDSVAAAVAVIGSNGTLTSTTVSYADSLVGTNNTDNRVTIVLKSSTLNRLAGCTRLKLGVVYATAGHANANGTTTGRTVKWYIGYKYP